MDIVTAFRHHLAPWVRARVGRTERGAALVEYALLVALIAVVCILAISTLGKEANSTFDVVGNSLSSVSGGSLSS